MDSPDILGHRPAACPTACTPAHFSTPTTNALDTATADFYLAQHAAYLDNGDEDVSGGGVPPSSEELWANIREAVKEMVEAGCNMPAPSEAASMSTVTKEARQRWGKYEVVSEDIPEQSDIPPELRFYGATDKTFIPDLFAEKQTRSSARAALALLSNDSSLDANIMPKPAYPGTTRSAKKERTHPHLMQPPELRDNPQTVKTINRGTQEEYTEASRGDNSGAVSTSSVSLAIGLAPALYQIFTSPQAFSDACLAYSAAVQPGRKISRRERRAGNTEWRCSKRTTKGCPFSFIANEIKDESGRYKVTVAKPQHSDACIAAPSNNTQCVSAAGEQSFNKRSSTKRARISTSDGDTDDYEGDEEGEEEADEPCQDESSTTNHSITSSNPLDDQEYGNMTSSSATSTSTQHTRQPVQRISKPAKKQKAVVQHEHVIVPTYGFKESNSDSSSSSEDEGSDDSECVLVQAVDQERKRKLETRGSTSPDEAGSVKKPRQGTAVQSSYSYDMDTDLQGTGLEPSSNLDTPPQPITGTSSAPPNLTMRDRMQLNLTRLQDMTAQEGNPSAREERQEEPSVAQLKMSNISTDPTKMTPFLAAWYASQAEIGTTDRDVWPLDMLNIEQEDAELFSRSGYLTVGNLHAKGIQISAEDASKDREFQALVKHMRKTAAEDPSGEGLDFVEQFVAMRQISEYYQDLLD